MIEFQTAWGWQAGLYLFLGGLGSGMFVSASALCFAQGERHRKTVAASFWISTACLALGLAALLSDLEKPFQALHMLDSFSSETSWMAYGAWGVFSALVVFGCAALLATKTTSDFLSKALPVRSSSRKIIRIVFLAAGSALALFVAFYTGMLLKSASGVPFWNSWLLPCLFVISALLAGANAVAVVAVVTKSAGNVSRKMRRRFAVSVVAATAVEGALLFLHVGIMLRGGVGLNDAQQVAAAVSAEALVFGELSLPFWLIVVGLGLIIPAALSLWNCFLKGRKGWSALAAGALCALAGECALRLLVLYVGVHADFLAAALSLTL